MKDKSAKSSLGRIEMMLNELLKNIALSETGINRGVPVPEVEVRGLTQDSRRVERGFLFVAVPGEGRDGHAYLGEAEDRGAVAAVVSRETPKSHKMPLFRVSDSRQALADLSARFFGDPSQKLRVIGITGTNGKTSISYLVESILTSAGRNPAVIGTINYRYGGQVFEAPHTTPESVDLQKLLAQMVLKGVTDVVMEVSSHALAMERVREVHFDVAAFTNLTQDHLDYHQDLESYFQAKRRLFTEFLPASVKPKKVAVLNIQNTRGVALSQGISSPIETLRVGWDSQADLFCETPEMTASGIKATVRYKGKNSLKIDSLMIGLHNLENILVAIGIALGLNIDPKAIERGIHAVTSVPGRLERIENNHGFHIFVDYAHTPDAIARVGSILRDLATQSGGRLLTLFGCGGDRDRSKRPLMGREAARVSDLVILTSDNPRTENPESILDEIAPGLAFENFPTDHIYRIVSREEALQRAVSLMKRGDFLFVAGKGHEDYQIIGKQKFHFSDQEILRKILK